MNGPSPAASAPPCDFCGWPGRLPGGPLCGTCRASAPIRCLYRPRKRRPPGWDEHLRRLALRAARGLPLFG